MLISLIQALLGDISSRIVYAHVTPLRLYGLPPTNTYHDGSVQSVPTCMTRSCSMPFLSQYVT